MVAPARRFEEDRLIEACLATLRSLGPHVRVKFAPATVNKRRNSLADGDLRFALGPRVPEETFVVETTRTNLSYALTAGLLARFRTSRQNWILFAPYVPQKIGERFAANGFSYVDAVGNCHVLSSKTRALVAHVEGKKVTRGTAKQSAGRIPSHLLTFAILAEPRILDEPVRRIAEMAGIGKTAAADQLNRLADRSLIQRTSSGGSLLRKRELLDRWISAYAGTVRPAWLIDRYRPQTTDPERLEREIEWFLGDKTWAFGGGAAAWRMTRFYRGEETVLHVATMPPDMPKALRMIPADDGPLTILRTPGVLAYAGTQSHLAHPLLVYTEMLASVDPRMVEAATEIGQRFLAEAT